MALLIASTNPTTGEAGTAYAVVSRLQWLNKDLGIARLELDHWHSQALRDAARTDDSLRPMLVSEIDIRLSDALSAQLRSGSTFAALYAGIKELPEFAGSADA